MNFLNEFPFEFYGEVFSIYYLDNGHFYIPVRRVCEAIGVEFTGQRRNILEDEAIADDTLMLTLLENSDLVRSAGAMRTRLSRIREKASIRIREK